MEIKLKCRQEIKFVNKFVIESYYIMKCYFNLIKLIRLLLQSYLQ